MRWEKISVLYELSNHLPLFIGRVSSSGGGGGGEQTAELPLTKTRGKRRERERESPACVFWRDNIHTLQDYLHMYRWLLNTT